LASPFDRAAFAAGLTTRRLGRTLLVRAATGSTNDEVWDAFAAGAPDGTVVVAEEQTRGRGRGGRAWHTTPGKGLALSVLLHAGCDRGRLRVLPLAAGLAVAQGLEALGARPVLKWPNDVLLDGRKVAGVLCESRRFPTGGAQGGTREVAVVGVGVNVAQSVADLPPELATSAGSLAMAGVVAGRERVAAAFLDAFERLWTELQEGSSARVLDGWRARAAFWGRPVAVRAPGGELRGVARSLDPDGALVLALADGTERTVLAGDLDLAPGEPGA
jgi:BirA family biotin operon repressor/biotin-[acetyl-CoA-carboxylase] ligase